jgi:hypothetical protein
LAGALRSIGLMISGNRNHDRADDQRPEHVDIGGTSSKEKRIVQADG